MTDNQFIEIDAPHLCVLANESDALNNDGIYGTALTRGARGAQDGSAPWQADNWPR